MGAARRFCIAAAAWLAAVRFVSANNILTAEHPPFGGRGYALQLDSRALYGRSETFVASAGSARRSIAGRSSGVFIFRAYVPGWMASAGVVYSHLTLGASGRWGWGDAVLEAGASRELGETRLRALAHVKAPTGDFIASRPANLGDGQWDLGPSFSVTRYFMDRSVDLDLSAQYLARLENAETRVTPGKQFSFAAAAARLLPGGVPARIGMEIRGVLDDPDRRGGAAVSAARRQLSVGPVAQLDLDGILPGWTLWPTAQYDFHNRNSARTRLFYLKVQYSY